MSKQAARTIADEEDDEDDEGDDAHDTIELLSSTAESSEEANADDGSKPAVVPESRRTVKQSQTAGRRSSRLRLVDPTTPKPPVTAQTADNATAADTPAPRSAIVRGRAPAEDRRGTTSGVTRGVNTSAVLAKNYSAGSATTADQVSLLNTPSNRACSSEWDFCFPNTSTVNSPDTSESTAFADVAPAADISSCAELVVNHGEFTLGLCAPGILHNPHFSFVVQLMSARMSRKQVPR